MPPPTPEQYLSNCLAAAVQDTAATRCEDLGLEPRPVEVCSTLIKGAGPERRVILPECQKYGARPTLRTKGLSWTQAQLELTAPLADGSTFRWPAEQRPGLPPALRRALAWGTGALAGSLLGTALGRLARFWSAEPGGWAAWGGEWHSSRWGWDS